MMKKIYLAISAMILVSACAGTLERVSQEEETRAVTISSDIEPFDGEEQTKVNVAGDSFIIGDFIRLKIICPFVSTGERGEYTDGNSYDSFYYLKRSESSWAQVEYTDGFDISGTYSASNSPSISSYYEAQQTPYVYVATTWSEERRFIAPNSDGNPSLYDHLTPVFHADQSKEKHYRASDVLWAQTFMQTGAWNIHLSFQHKMACLDITVDDSNLTRPNPDYPLAPGSQPTIPAPLSENVVLTLEGMPDIDQAEIVVGDYYADASKYNSGYGYMQKSSCSYENNGKVLGIAVNDDAARRARIMQMTGNPSTVGGSNSSVISDKVPNTGIYTAYKQASKHYRLIVPPCNLDPSSAGKKNAVFWLRDGTRRFNVALDRLVFEEGKLYPVTLKLGTAPGPGPSSVPSPEP